MKPAMSPKTVKVALKLAGLMLAVGAAVIAKLSLGEQLSFESVLGIITNALATVGDAS